MRHAIRHVGPERGDRCGGVVRDAGEHREIVFAVERPSPRQHLVQHNAERPDVRARIDVAAANLLGRHVRDRSQRRTSAREVRGPGEFRQTEVHDLHEAVARDHRVGRLHIAVHEAGLVRARQGLRHLDRDVERVRHRNGASRDPLLQRLAVVVRHRQEQFPIGCLVDFVNGADVGVIERGGGLRFLPETVVRVFIFREIGREEFQRNKPVQTGVERFVHHSHPAAAEPFDDAIVGDGLANHGGQSLLPSVWAFNAESRPPSRHPLSNRSLEVGILRRPGPRPQPHRR